MASVFTLSASLALYFSWGPRALHDPCANMLICPQVSLRVELLPPKAKSCQIWHVNFFINFFTLCSKWTVWMCHAWVLLAGTVLYHCLNRICTPIYITVTSCCAWRQHMLLIPSDQRHCSFIMSADLNCRKHMKSTSQFKCQWLCISHEFTADWTKRGI